MRKPFAILSVAVLVLSLSLVVLLITGFRQRQNAKSALAIETRPTLVVAAPRSLSDVVIAPTVTPPLVASPVPLTPTSSPLPTELPPTPLSTEIVATPGIAAPRMFLLVNTVQSQLRLSNYCAGFGTPVSLRLFDWQTGSTASLSNAAIAGIPLGWDASASIWQGYQSLHPFDQPDDARERWRVSLFLPDGRVRWIGIVGSPTTPDVYYVYGFQRTDPFAGANGAHYGVHPCRAFAISASEVDRFLTTIDRYQDVVRYPPLITGSDSRWVHGIARPVVENADLRSIPTTDYNDPIGSISQQIDLWYAVDPAWGSWAQVRLGSVQGWVDMGKVSLTPER